MENPFHVGPWLVEPGLNTVSRNSTSVRLEPKQMEVLVCLAQQAGQTVSKEKLLQLVWPDTFVTDEVLTRSIFALRRAFEDDAKDSRIIQTIPKRGYRLLATVEWADPGPLRPITAAGQSRNTPSRRTRVAAGAVIVLLLAAVLALSSGGLRELLPGRNAAPVIRSLAVLPLQNLSGEPTQEYFADGMTEELITELSHISALKVISRTSVMLYKKSNKTLPQIARELGVDAIVEGSVLRSGDRVRITAQLIRAADDAHIWAESYDRDVGEVLTLQSMVARTIAEQIRVEMTPGERQRLQEPRSINRAALEAYLQGEYHENSIGFGSGLEERHKAAEYYREAIRQDPTFARAYVGLAVANIVFVTPSPADVPTVKDALEKALALDPNLAEAHLWMARFKTYYEWDFANAEQEFRRSVELDPNNARAHEFYGDFLDIMGRLDEGSHEEQIAQLLDPEGDHLTDGLKTRGKYERILAILRGVVAAHPTDGSGRYWMFWALLHVGRDKEAVAELQQAITLYGHPEMAAPLRKAFATSGRAGLLRLWGKDLETLVPDGLPPAFVGETYALLGDADKAFLWAERGFAVRDGFLLDLNSNPDWASLRSDPRFKDLVRRIGLPTSPKT